MRAKKLLDLVPVPSHVIKHAYSRITLTRFTTAYFIIALLYALILSGLQLASHISNKRADETLLKIINVANIQDNAIPFLSSDGDGQGVLRLCNGIPSSNDDNRCQTLVGPGATNPLGGTILANSFLPTSAPTPTTTTTELVASETEQAVDVPAATPQPAPTDEITAASFTSTTQDSGLAVVDITTAAGATTTTSIALPSLSLVATFVDVDLADVFTTTTTSNDRGNVNNQQTTTASISTTSSTSTTLTSTSTSTTSTSSTSTSASTTSTSTTSTTEEQSTSTTSTETSTSTSTTSSSQSEERATTTSTTESSTSISTSTSELAKSTDTSESNSQENNNNNNNESTPSATAAAASDREASAASTDSAAPTSDPDLSTGKVGNDANQDQNQDQNQNQDAGNENQNGGNENQNGGNDNAQSSSQDEGSTASSAADSSSEAQNSGENQNNQRRDNNRYVSRPVAMYLRRRAFDVVPVTNATTGTVIGLNVTDLRHNGTSAVTFVDILCAATLTFPEEQLQQSSAEDLVMLGYHLWLFGLGLFAILNESIPHLLAAFVSSVLALIWSVVHLVQIGPLQQQWQDFVTDGACNGLEILPSFWDQRKLIEIPAVVFNSVFVIALGVVGFRLLSVYRRQTEKLTGGSDVIKHLYKTTLILSIIIQIAAFLLIASLALWIHQLFGSAIASFSASTPVLKGVGILSILLALPWFYIGWYAVRREHKLVMLVFFGATIFFLATWVVVFSSDVYRLVFTKWTFFAVITVATFFLLVASLITSIVCRLHFGQGLVVQLTEKSKAQEPEGTWDFSGSAEQAWERFDKESVRQSQFTNSDRQSAFSYGLRSPVPPMPRNKLVQPSRFSG